MTKSTRPPLDALVERTEGLQPWRRIFHATNAVVLATAVTVLPITHRQSTLLIGAVALTLLTADVVRLSLPGANELFFRLFWMLASPREAKGIASSTWYMLGITLALVVASTPDAVSAILVLGLADPAASYLGRRWGRRPFLGGTVEGTTIFFVVSLAVLLARHAWPVALGTALVVTLVERRSWPLDDNLAVPLACALVLTAAGSFG